MGAKMPYGDAALRVGQGAAATGAVLIPIIGGTELVPISAAATNSGFKFRAKGRVVNGGVSTDVH